MNDEARRAEVRADARAARSAIDPGDAAIMADHAAARALELPEMQDASAVAAYHARDGELDPAPLARMLARRGATLWWPVTVEEQLEWVAAPVDGDLETGRFGIPEPAGARVPMPRLDAVIVPVVAVDRAGHRLGHGHGFYDRYLSGAHEVTGLRIGYAHDVQVVERVAAEPWDVPVDVVITPSETIRTG